MNIPIWARRSVLAAGLMMASGAYAATSYDLMVNHDAFQVVAGGEAGDIGTGSAVVDGPVGGNFVYRAKPKINGDTGSVSNAVLTQKLPAGAIFQGIDAPSGVSCTPALAVGTEIQDGDLISCTIPTLTEEEQHIDFKVILPTYGTDHKAFASITAPDNTDVNAGNDDNIERNITTYERADLAVAFTGPAPDSQHQQGTVVNYTIQASNTDSEYAYPLKAGEKAVVRFSLPSGTAFQGSPSSPDNAWACTDETDNSADPPVAYKECTYIAPADGVGTGENLPLLTIPVVIEAASGGSTALVSVEGKTVGDQSFVDAYPDNNSAERSITYARNTQLDMKLVKTVSPSTVDAKAGSVEVFYTLAATRNSGGMIPEPPITITDTLPIGVKYKGVIEGSGWTCEASPMSPTGQDVVECSAAEEAIGSDGHLNVLTFKANVDTSRVDLTEGQAVIKNEARLDVHNEPEANKYNNNTSRADLTVSNRIALSTEKSTPNVGVVADGAEFEYLIKVHNDSDIAVSDSQTITVIDQLDAKLEYVNAEGDWSCEAEPATWSATTPQTVTCTSTAGIAAKGSNNLTLKVEAHIPSGELWGTIGNKASVSCPEERYCVGAYPILTNDHTLNMSDKKADLSITKEAEITPDSSAYGDDASGAEVVYTLKVKNAVPDGQNPTDFQKAKTVVVEDRIENLLSNTDSGGAHPITGTPRYNNGRFVIAEVGTLSNGVTAEDCIYTSTGSHTTTVRCELKNVPVGDEEYVITIKARQYVNARDDNDLTNEIKNVATVRSPDTAEFDTENNSADATVELTALTNMKAQKQASVENAAAGQKIDYTLTAANHGPSAARQVKVVDTLPVGMIWVSAPTISGGSCTLGNDETIAAGLVVTDENKTMTCTWTNTFSGGFKANGNALTTRDVKYALRSPNEDYAASATNYAQVETVTPETIPLEADDTDNKTSKTVTFDKPKLNVLINMGHTKDGLPISENSSPASQTQYTITVTNSGESTSYATNVEMFNHFPAAGSTAVFGDAVLNSVALVGGTNRFSTDDCVFVTTPKNGLQCKFDWLAPGESVDIKFTLQAQAIDNGDIPVGTIRHEASVSADGEYLDEDTDVEADNTVTDRTSAYDGALINPEDVDKLRFVDLSIKKTSGVTSPDGEDKDAAEVGDTIRYTLTVTNEEPKLDLVDGNAVVTDVLPEGLEFVGPVPAGCTWTAPELRCLIIDLAAGASTAFEFDVKVTQLSYGQRSIKNTATVDSPGDDNPGNNEDPEETPSVPPLNPAPVPVDNPLALLALILGMGWMARRFHMRKHA